MQLYLKRDSDTGVFLWILRNTFLTELLWTTVSDYSTDNFKQIEILTQLDNVDFHLDNAEIECFFQNSVFLCFINI